MDFEDGVACLPETWESAKGTVSSKCGIMELSRREDAATALPVVWEGLAERAARNVSRNSMLKIPYRLDLADPAWKALALWTKDPGETLEWIQKPGPSGKSILDAWAAVHVTVTLNGDHPALERKLRPAKPPLTGLSDLCNALGERYGVPGTALVTVKVGDPIVKYRAVGDADWTCNWLSFDRIYSWIARLGFKTAHYGPLDMRGPWAGIKKAALAEGVELWEWDWDDRADLDRAVARCATMAACVGVRLVTCADKAAIGRTFPRGFGFHTSPIRQGICVSLRGINKALAAGGVARIGSSRKDPGGKKRNCHCPVTRDVGKKISRGPGDARSECHACAYCFVPKNAPLKAGGKRARDE